MKMHLISLHPSLWEIVVVGVNIPKKDELITPEMMQDLHRNAQAIRILNNGLSEEERRRVKGMEIAKESWDKLQLAHEGDRKAKLGKIELIQGELDNFVLLKGETLQELFDRFMELINKIRALGSEEWDDENKVARRFLRTYQVKNMTLATIIRERDDFEAMDAHTLLGKLQHHEMTDQAAIAAARRIPNAIMPNESENKGVALQATNEEEASKSSKAKKSKKIVEESSSDDSLDDENQNVAMFIKTFKKMTRGDHKYKRRYGDKYKKDKYKKRRCYRCGEFGHYIADCPKKKEESKERNKDKYNEDKSKNYKKKQRGYTYVGEEWDSDDESSSSDDEGIASVAIHKATPTPRLFTNLSDDEDDNTVTCLFTNLSDDEDDNTVTCLMAKGKKFKTKHDEFSAPYSPQQNGVVERKNRTLIDMARTMLDEYKISDQFWAKAVNTACHAINRLYLHKIMKNTSYELLTGNKPNVSYFRVLKTLKKFMRRAQNEFEVKIKKIRSDNGREFKNKLKSF
ncbi:hypothetical protein U9M48_035581 [Paspalum notatum var. saurae]|uniref:Uncharacterized protein n=1 Tax=Paspalum notatum var. saurae TaxID=547442 RepID=A0AAQ3X7V5_PASNO